MSRSGNGPVGSICGVVPIPRSRIQTVVTPEERRKAFHAKFSGGFCPLCCNRIRKGQLLFFRSGRKPMHVTCPP